ncbi:MAG: GDSL-type esterase/lipase family protein [Rhodanobacter sp.]
MTTTLPRFLALGDSYTVGEAVPAADAWPAQLAARLRAKGNMVADPQIIAMTGWTCEELGRGMDAATLAPPYALVTLQIGVNDQYRGQDVAGYRQQFAALLASAIALAGNDARRVVVVSIPDWGTTPFATANNRDAPDIARQLDAYNADARAQTAHRGAHWCDVTDLSRQHGHLLAADGLHPDSAQYRLWSARILPAARAALAAS